jgi:fumarate hydratase subunit beta
MGTGAERGQTVGWLVSDEQELMEITTPLTQSVLERLRAGDNVHISGTIYVARDAAHTRMAEALDNGQALPFDAQDQIIYYMGPSPARPGKPIGSAGPTTSYRMDPYAVRLMEAGIKGMIGKGHRSLPVRQAMQRHGAVYFAAVGGAGALLARTVLSADVIAYGDLGPEAALRLVVESFPAVVINDIYGADAYEQGRSQYKRS